MVAHATCATRSYGTFSYIDLVWQKRGTFTRNATPLVPPMEFCQIEVIWQMVHGGGREGGLLEKFYYYINIPAAIAIVLSNQNFMSLVQPALNCSS